MTKTIEKALRDYLEGAWNGRSHDINVDDMAAAVEAALSTDAEPVYEGKHTIPMVRVVTEDDIDIREPAPPAPSVAVKTLKWIGLNAKTDLVSYWISSEAKQEHVLYFGRQFIVGTFASVDAAKAAAQADYEARIRSALSAQVQDVAETDMAYKEARQLAMSLHAQHYSDVKQWEPLDDLRGVISQIDNMTCGLVAKQGAEGQDDTHLEEIAGGAWGDDPATRGRARDELARRRAAAPSAKQGEGE